MRVSNPSLPLILVGTLLLGGVLGMGCASDSPGSTTSEVMATAPETTSVSDVDEAPSPSSSTPAAASRESSRTVAQRLADASVAARIKQALVRERSLRPFNFDPEVVRGRVVLRGDVDTREQYRRAARLAETLAGVETVRNQITVKGRSVSEVAETVASSSTSGTAYYTVKRGDTLWEIARAYGVSIPEIKALNPYSASPPRPGERLRVR